MKRKILFLLVVLWLSVTACGNSTQTSSDATVNETGNEMQAEAEAAEVAEAETEAETAVAEAVEAEAETEAAETQTATEEAKEPEEIEAEPEAEAEPKEVTEQVTSFEEPKVMYATTAVNIRRGPGTDYEVISHVTMAQQVETTGQAETGWYQIMLEGQPAYISDKYLSETKVEILSATTEAPAEQAAAQTAQQPPAPEQTAQQPTEPEQTIPPAGIIMVGDSRCVQMHEAIGEDGCMWVCENSKEYTWFCEKAIPKFDKHVGNGTKVVINLGVNDPEHYKDYVGTINAKAAEWAQRGATTYLVSVNPVWENPYTTKEEVDTFNANVPGMLIGVHWIDTHTWMVENGYRILDGLHYDAPTYVNIYNLIMGSL